MWHYDEDTSEGSESMKWQVVLEHDDKTGDWAAWCPQLAGCASAGRTREEALNNIREAIELYLELDDGTLPRGAQVYEVTAG